MEFLKSIVTYSDKPKVLFRHLNNWLKYLPKIYTFKQIYVCISSLKTEKQLILRAPSNFFPAAPLFLSTNIPGRRHTLSLSNTTAFGWCAVPFWLCSKIPGKKGIARGKTIVGLDTTVRECPRLAKGFSEENLRCFLIDDKVKYPIFE